MTKFSRSWKHDQVFISFRGENLRNNLVSHLKEELKRSNINFFIDEDETRGIPITVLFERIRESGVALVFFSDKYPESHWCLDELVQIKKQMETGYLDAFPVFYEVPVASVKRQTGSFGNKLLKTEDCFRDQVDRRSDESILQTEARIWGWRQALVYVGGRFGFSHKKGNPEGPLVSNIVAKLKKMIEDISCRRNDHFIIEKALMHPQKPVTFLLQALDLKKSDLEELITKPTIHKASASLVDGLVFLDMISLNNPGLGQRLIEHGQAGSIFLLLLGSLDVYYEEFDFQPLLLSKKPQLFPANKLIVSSQEIQDQNSSPLQVTNSGDVLTTAESNDNTPNRLGEDKTTDDALTCFTFLCNIIKRFAMMISPPQNRVFISVGETQLEENLVTSLISPSPHRVFISFGDKQLEKTLVSSLKKELESKGISVYVEDEKIKESKVAIVVFSAKYPESPQCLDELVEIKKLMDAGEIDPLPIYYKLENVSKLAEAVKQLQSWFLNRLLKIEQEVRKDVNRESERSILDTEARIWGWRQAILSISARPGLSNEHSSDPLFFTDVVTKVKELFEFKDRPKKSKTTNQVSEETSIVTATAITTTRVKSFDNDLFYSLASFLQALNLEITDLEGFTEHNGLISLSLKGHTNLVCFNLGSLENLVRFQCSKSFELLRKGFALNHPGISRFEEPPRIFAIESNQPQQLFDSRLIVSSQQNHQNHINPVQNPNDTTPEARLF